MTGTIMVVSMRWSSMVESTRPGSNRGIDTDVAPLAGMPRTPATTAAWNMGAWNRKRREAGSPICDAHVVQVQDLGPLVEERALGKPGGASGVHQDHRVVLFGVSPRDGLGGGDQLLVADRGAAVGHAVAGDAPDDHDGVDLGPFVPGPVEQRREHRIREHHPGVGVGQDVRQLGGAEPDVQRRDDRRRRTAPRGTARGIRAHSWRARRSGPGAPRPVVRPTHGPGVGHDRCGWRRSLRTGPPPP